MLAFFLMVAAVVLGGCGGESRSLFSANPTGSTRESENKTLKVWAWSTPAKSLRMTARQFEEDHPDIRVQVDMLGSNMSRARFLLALSAGVGAPDVAMIEIQNVEQYAATGTLADLSSLAVKYKKSFPQAFWENCQYDGKTYGIPWDMGPCGVFYKAALFHEFDIDPTQIETWDDYVEAGKLLVQRSQGRTKMLSVSLSEMSHLFQMLLQQAGGQVFDEQGRIAINSEPARQALQTIRTLVEAGITTNIAPHGYEMYASFSNDAIASYPMPVWFGGMIKDIATQQSAEEFEWDVFRLPALQAGGLRNSNRGGSVLVVPAQSILQKEAHSFIEFALCRVESHLQHYGMFNLFPAYFPALKDPRMDEPSAFFSGNRLTQLFSQELESIPTMNRTTDWLRAENYMNQALGEWAASGMELNGFLESLAQKLASRTGREVAPSKTQQISSLEKS